MNNSEKILSTTPKFDVVEREGRVGIKSTVESVVILPFVTDDQGLPLMLGVLKEKNPFREGGYSISLISGTSEEEDPDFLMVDAEHPCFGVDVTGIERGTATTDGSESERLSEFIFIPANDVVKAKDVFVPAIFLKLFKFVVGMDLYNRDDSTFGKTKGFTVDI